MKNWLSTLLATAVLAGATRAANPVVVVDTSLGEFKVELFEDKAPLTVKNFLGYVEDKHYDNTIFHRVKADFMIQGGGHDLEKKEKKARAEIKNESANGLKNERYTVAMARKQAPDTAAAQFFINVVDNPFLNKDYDKGDGAGYCVFGKVIAGTDVIEKIKAARTSFGVLTVNTPDGPQRTPSDEPTVPVDNVVIKSIRKGEPTKDEPKKEEPKKEGPKKDESKPEEKKPPQPK